MLAWSVNEPGRIKELLSLGIAGIITDVPEVAIKVREGLTNHPEYVRQREAIIRKQEQDDHL